MHHQIFAALLCSALQLVIGCYVPLVAFLNPVGAGLYWSDSGWGVVVLFIGMGVSYLLYRWMITQWLHKMLVAFQRSAAEAPSQR